MSQSPGAGLKFEAALAELEQIVQVMEGGTMELEASIAAYRRGLSLMQHCQRQLDDAETQLSVLDDDPTATPST